MNNILLEEFQDKIGYRFKNTSLLERALTTKKFGNQYDTPHFEGLDTLGDTLISFVLVLKFINKGIFNREYIGKARIKIGENINLGQLAHECYNLEKYIIKLPHEKVVDTVIIADVFEAIVGAIFLDSNQNYKVVEQILLEKSFEWLVKYLSTYDQMFEKIYRLFYNTE